MKKWRTAIFVILALMMSSVFAYGNTGPVTWYQYPGISMITIDEDTPVTVLKEDLHFDFSEEMENDYSLVGQVSAQYKMKNTGNEDIVSRMVFPFIKNLWSRDEDQIEVLLDGSPISYKIYYGENVKQTSVEDGFQETVELEDILKSVTEEKYSPKNYEYEEKGTLYRIHLESGQEEHMHVDASFTLSEHDSRIFVKGNYSYGYDNETNEFVIGTWLDHETRYMDIFSLDEELKLDIRGYENGTTDAVEVTDFTYEIEEIEMDVVTYYHDFLTTDELIYSSVFIPEDKNIYYEVLDQALERERLITGDHISSLLASPRYVLIAYEVPFEAMEEKTVEVRYHTLGSMDKRETVEPTYTYEYFLHPAKYWKDFKDLTIRISPSESYPYVVESNLDLKKEADGTYTGTFETLPEEDLSFTLYDKEAITTMEKIKGTVARNQYLLLFAGFAVLSVLAVVMLGLLIRKIIHLYRKTGK